MSDYRTLGVGTLGIPSRTHRQTHAHTDTHIRR